MFFIADPKLTKKKIEKRIYGYDCIKNVDKM